MIRHNINFINIILLLFASVYISGCSTTSSSKGHPDVKKFTKGVVPLSLRSSRVSADLCPKTKSLWKKEKWESLVKMTNSCIKQQKWSKVESLGNHISQVSHISPWGPYYLSLAAESRKEYGRALWMVELAIKKAPDNGLLYYQKGRVNWALKNYQVAVKSMRRSVQLDRNVIEAHLFLGQVYYRDQDYSLAARHMEAVLVVESRNFIALSTLGRVRAVQNDSQSSIEYLEKASSIKPKNAVIRMEIAEVYEDVERDYNEALSNYKRAARLFKKSKNQKLVLRVKEKIKTLENTLARVMAVESKNSRKPASEEKVAQ